jgi:hypothetical protein
LRELPNDQPRNEAMKKMFKILCPIERKDGSTHWMRVGTGFPNRDDSVNLYLDVLPANQKLQLRELDAEDMKAREAGSKRPERAQKIGDTPDALPF